MGGSLGILIRLLVRGKGKDRCVDFGYWRSVLLTSMDFDGAFSAQLSRVWIGDKGKEA